MDTPNFEHGRVYFKQFGAERVKAHITKPNNALHLKVSSLIPSLIQTLSSASTAGDV